MNIVELLILLAFIFFPLLQGLLEKLGGNRRGEGQLPPEDEQHDYSGPIVVEPRGEIETTFEEAPADTEWSAGWGSWPSTKLPEELTVEGPPEKKDAETFVPARESAVARTLPQPARARTPVVALEPVRIDRVEPRPRPEPLPPVPQRQKSSLESALGNRRAVQQAMVLAEVLGPPRALQPLEARERV